MAGVGGGLFRSLYLGLYGPLAGLFIVNYVFVTVKSKYGVVMCRVPRFLVSNELVLVGLYRRGQVIFCRNQGRFREVHRQVVPAVEGDRGGHFVARRVVCIAVVDPHSICLVCPIAAFRSLFLYQEAEWCVGCVNNGLYTYVIWLPVLGLGTRDEFPTRVQPYHYKDNFLFCHEVMVVPTECLQVVLPVFF